MKRSVAGTIVLVLLAWLQGAAFARADDTHDAEDRMRGQANAPVTLIEYSDFTCGYCLKFFKETWPRIQARYVDTGKVRFLYRDYPRADQGPGVEAATAARCAGAQGKYWAMHDRLFAEGGRLQKTMYVRHAAAMGLDQAAFERCLKDGRYTKSIFTDREEANRWGFHGTPGFILMHTASEPTDKKPAIAIPGAFPFDMFAEEIDRLLNNAAHSNAVPAAPDTEPTVLAGAPPLEPVTTHAIR
ncbi:MAG: thioredoxin domain-containing protein [Nitrospiraceae bacterium]|jgi:protein-disulfide isomerase|nr:thioredoxin domain-containing protein [Nitrospiraceae bacterium]